MTGKQEDIHENFRLFATMNPGQGVTTTNTGRRALSPAFPQQSRMLSENALLDEGCSRGGGISLRT